MKRSRWFASRVFSGMMIAFTVIVISLSVIKAEETLPFTELGQEYGNSIHPLLKQFCNDCHSTEAKEGELDLERFANFAHVRQDPAPWQKVIEMLGTGEMPPEESPQLSADQKQQLLKWVQVYLDAEARANAGDPGPVVLRRLNNAEYTYTIRDLTQVELNPAEQFPVDSAAGEGFTNTGAALVMSPSMVTKYFDAAKDIARHVVFLPDGIRFSEGTSHRDFTDETVAAIREIYARHTGPRGDDNVLNKWNVADPTVLTNDDGRVDLAHYLSVLLQHRDALQSKDLSYEAIAEKEKVNAKYLHLLSTMLNAPLDDSLLLNQLRKRWETLTPEQGDSFIAEIRAWQQQLWKYNTVGQFGSVRPWQEGVDPIASSQPFSLSLKGESQQDEFTIYLQANGAGEESAEDVVRWHQPRFVRSGQTPLLLRDLRAISILLKELRRETFSQTSSYLAAAEVIRQQAVAGENSPDLNELAKKHNVDPLLLPAWLNVLGLNGNNVAIQEYLHVAYQDPKHIAVRGWGFPNADALTLVSNASDEPLRIPGDLQPHSIAVHPRPERWVAAGWKSPLSGAVRIEAEVQHAHRGCGNGILWSLEFRRGSQRQVLHTGPAGLGQKVTLPPVENLSLQQGDLISLVINPRDNNHSCDLTRIDLTIQELNGNKRNWSLRGDCADTIGAGNPHPDQHGNLSTWHFYTGKIGEEEPATHIPQGSLLAKWSEAKSVEEARPVAEQLEQLLTEGPTDQTTEVDQKLYALLNAYSGLLFSQLDYATLVNRLADERLGELDYGIDPRNLEGTGIKQITENGDLIANAPVELKFKLPRSLLEGADFVTTATVESNGGSVQVHAALQSDPNWPQLQPGLPILVPESSTARTTWLTALNDFRQLFPLAMCYPKVVPVDEGISIVLHHREDEPLARLMLSEEEAQQLDRLWKELRYVSQDDLKSMTVLEQLIQFATQDGEPSLYEPLTEPYQQRAEEYQAWLIETEPAHLDALVDFAGRAYRRLLTESESNSIRELYAELRKQELEHEEAFRLTLARVLTSPAFLYRLEQPGSGTEPTAVSDWELANRLSYFLWSSMPDAELSRLAAENRLHDPEVLAAQTKRMLADPKIRRMAIEFGCQWLHIRDFDQHDEKSESHFPEFSAIRDDMYEESILFFEDLLQHDGSIMSLLKADHTFLNEDLAAFYGIPNVNGAEWRRVENVGQYGRGGVLTQATTLSKQSGASRTSAILRGNWVYESLLGERLPRPPKGVPVLPEDVPADLTERQLIEQHSSVESCAKCHARIDAFGFSLEGYDAIGRFRTHDEGGHSIDTLATLKDGTE
ncbi:MAG: DUF1592 domain-containing protein, partial [Planctomycetaceae bacterium]|nr:DUF1592 domain-containing protein [Planctomycetaceae bacterium]